jgi:hypothetical protein
MKDILSETRLVEVLEYACKDKDLPKLDGIVTGKDAEFKVLSIETLVSENEYICSVKRYLKSMKNRSRIGTFISSKQMSAI